MLGTVWLIMSSLLSGDHAVSCLSKCKTNCSEIMCHKALHVDTSTCITIKFGFKIFFSVIISL